MPVTDVQKDTDAATMTVTAEFDAPVDRVWQLYADPRQLERWWGPPTYPATVHAHDLTPGGRVHYTMTGPEGDVHGGIWDVIAVDAPRHLELEDSFADPDGTPNPDMPTTTMVLDLADREGGGTVMTVVSTFASTEAMQDLVAMGMEEGMQQSMGQMDALLAGTPAA
ncbi:SRPBCC domain-containing protein [Euzebya sp.]|uniref:SRPBCC family protein n=1 Tax=Euzebya sp. TaxID=1971409 RepID=UPI0035149A4B